MKPRLPSTRLLTMGALLGATLMLPYTAVAGVFEQAVKQAEAAIDRAKAVNNEWRDSRKILKKGIEAQKAGDHDKAMKLVAKAHQQGDLAVAQAAKQKNAGPR